ncbi:MAG: nucleoside-diphosphate sugar epimerase [Bacteroidetes bacterium]|nr:MAG: nucleoside-diphosphate sugar epimerase [Bacteroidota bacterium]
MKDKKGLTGIVFGSSGLTGHFLVELLLKDTRYENLVLFVRKETRVLHGKIRQIVFNPDEIDKIKHEITGDHVFCCIGTTIRKAGSQDSFYKTDHDLVINIARVASQNGISVFSVISSLGADLKSGNFYLKTKGSMEADLRLLNVNNLNILRPSLLLGMRQETRLLEEISKFLFKHLKFVFSGRFRKYRPVHAETVAMAMIRAANERQGVCIIESDKIEELGASVNTVSF